MTAERIALISDYEGNVAALQAALRALKQDAPDSIVLAGDIIASPFSPDPPSETIALLRSESVQAIPGNTDRYLLDWGTPAGRTRCGCDCAARIRPAAGSTRTEALTPLFHFRKELYDNLGLRQDSLFELVDALLTTP